jgi:enamine deaminase RidA (YjgF/YER057c/UK114 family)
LSSKGLLSQQVRDALRALQNQAGGGTIVKLRAFVAGSGDTRRVAAILGETFAGRRIPLPALTVAQVGALAAPGVQVVVEAAVEARRAVNPNGLGFFTPQWAEGVGLEDRMVPLVRAALARTSGVLARAGLDGGDVVRATCFVTSVEDVWEARALAAAEFPKAVISFVQPERSPAHAGAGCEVTARLRARPGGRLRVLADESGRPVASLAGPGRLVLAGGQMAFGFEEADARLAVQRLGRTLGQFKTSFPRVAYLTFFALSRGIGDLAARIASEEAGAGGLPPAAVLNCVALPSIDASFAVDAIAAGDGP